MPSSRLSVSPILPVALLTGLLLPSYAARALTVTHIGEVTRPSSSTYGAEQISGITWAGGDLYYAVDDNDKKLYPLTIAINRASGAITSVAIGTGVAMSGASDAEGCAYDPCSGRLWVSDETGAYIREHDVASGAIVRTAPVPSIQKQYYGNYSLEALTISGDGRTMWTANEESLKCDGTNSTLTAGTTIRLTRFTRESVHANWTADGQWAYLTQPIAENSSQYLASSARNGVAALTALPDGTLLVLERGYRGWGSLADDFKNYIYAVNFSGATDITDIPSLKEATYTHAGKSCLWSDMTLKLVNYEGMCLGPRLDDGSCVLVVVADGGSGGNEKIMTLKLSGLDIRTMNFAEAVGAEPVGGPYRYVSGSTVTASLPGAGNPYEAETRVHAAWQAPANGASGEGSVATFALAADDTLTWSTVTNASLPMLAADSFERLPANTEAPDIMGWSGDGYVTEATYAAPVPAGYPLGDETHTAVLVVDGDVERDYSDIPGDGSMLDAMVRVTLETSDNPVADSDGQVALFFDAQGLATLQHKTPNGSTRLRTALSTRTFANGDWVRASFLFDYSTGTHWCQVRLDGEPCVTDAGVRSPADPRSPGSWYRTLDASATKVSSLLLRGSGAVDDVAFYDAAGVFEFQDVGATINGVPCTWLADQGLSWDTSVDIDGDTADELTEYVMGTDPLDETSVDSLRIVGTGFDEYGRFQVSFLGRADRARFQVVATNDLAAASNLWPVVPGAVTPAAIEGETNVWTQTSAPAPDDDTRFYRVRATLAD